MSDRVSDVTDESFEAEVLGSDEPVLVDIWAPWCGPCRMVSPIIEELAESNDGKLKTCKINVDENPETANKFGINAIPTILLFKNGEEVQDLRMTGVQSKAAYQETVDKLLAS